MNQLPYDDPATLKHILMRTLSALNTDRQIGEQVLTQMMDTDCQRFVFTLIDHIILPGDPTDDPVIRQISLILLKNCLRNKKKCRLTPATSNIIRGKMLTLMLNNTNHHIESSLQQILEILYKQVSNAQDIETDLINIKHKTATTGPAAQKTLFLTLESLFHTPKLIKKQLALQFEDLAIWLIETGNQQTQAIITEARGIKLAVTATNQRRDIPFFPKEIKTLESWLETVIQVISSEFPPKKLTPELVDLLQSKPYYQKLSAILPDILTLNVVFEDQPDSNDLIATPTDTPAHYEINSVKAKALLLFTIILEVLEKVNPQIDVTKFDVFQAVQNQILQFVLSSLDSFMNSQKYRDLCENEEIGEVEEILVESSVFLRGTAAFKQLYSTIDISIPDLLMRSILPLLKPTPSELERYGEGFVDYVNNLSDICFEQKLVSRRSAIASFLNAMISMKEKNDDSKLAVIELLLDLAEFSITPDFENYPKLAQYEELSFITETQPESRLDTCLLALACLHKTLNNDLKKVVFEFMQKHYSHLIDSSSMETKINLCFFIASYSDNILNSSQNEDLAADCFRFILESVNIKDEESAYLIAAATKALEILFKKNSLSSFLVPYAMDTLRVLTEIFLENGEENIMNVILEILSNYELQILEQPDFLVEFIKTLVTNIEEGFQKEKCVGDENVKLENMRDLLQNIFKKKQYILMVQNDLEQVAQPLFALLQEMHINNIQDTIKHRHLLSLLIPLLPAVKGLTQTLLTNISQAFPLVVEITHSLNYLFFKLSDIIKDSDAIAEFNRNPEMVQVLIEIIIKALHQKNGFDRSELICQGALLLQLLFQYVDSLTESHIEKILEATGQLLKTTVNPLLRVQLICVILNALHAKFETSQTILLKLDLLGDFIKGLLENVLNFDDFSYCRQVLVIGLSTILSHTKSQSCLPELFNVLISLLQTQQYIVAKTQGAPEKFDYKSDKILLRKFLDNQDLIEEEQITGSNQETIEDEDQDDEEESDELNFENRSINKIVDDDFKTDFKKKNPLEFFKSEMSSFQQNNGELFEKLVQSVPEKKKNFLENLLKK